MASKPTIFEIEEYMALGTTVKTKSENTKEWKEGLNGMTKEDYNLISKPKHYMLFEDKNIEVRDVIAKLVEKIGQSTVECTPTFPPALFESDYVQLMQYLMRFMDKNGVEDLKKARWYLDKMIESY